MEILWRDIRYSFRLLFKNPIFACIAVLALALGIGATSTIFSVVMSVLVRELPYRQTDRLVYIGSRNQGLGISQGFLSTSDVVDYPERSKSFEQFAAYTGWPINLMNTDRPERLEGMLVTTNFFQALGVSTLHGRPFAAEEGVEGRDHVVILSYGLWQRRFAGDPFVIGKTLTLDAGGSNEFTVVGVMPAEFQFPVNTDLWMPEDYQPPKKRRNARFIRAIARLKSGVTGHQAQQEMDAIASVLAQQYPETNSGWNLTLTPFREHLFGKADTALLMLLGAVASLLLIACADVANLQLARAASRQREIALRVALGASRRQIIRQLLTENLVLAIMGGSLGLLLTVWGVRILRAFGPASIPRLNEVSVNASILVFTTALTLLTGFLFGLVPALQLSKVNTSETLKECGRTSGASPGRNQIRNILIVSQVALAVILLTGAGLFIESFYRLSEVSPGFNTDHVLAMTISLTTANYSEDQRASFFQEVIRRTDSLPGVVLAGVTSHLPLSGRTVNLPFSIEGRGSSDATSPLDADIRVISPDYFQTIGIPLKKGRHFTQQDTSTVPGVVIINESCAHRFFGGQDPFGQRLTVGPSLFKGEIVGVVGDVKHRGLETEVRPEIYIPYLQQMIWPVMNLVVRTSAEASTLAPAVRGEIQAINKNQPIFNVNTMEQMLSDSLAERRFNMLLLIIFAAVALVLAIGGLYGVMAYFVTQRTHEIGVRIALGAQTRNILVMVVGHGMILILCGDVLGLVGAFAATRTISSLLYGVSTTDPLIHTGVIILLALVALMACYFPARRAARTDPAVVLRNE